ncbi:MAG: phosphoribosyl-AMP cyclohydrolase [Marinobacterium sp.]|nr:phosphoribosyl-AMP cyclohydrolase [Marinobacterium sp.]
MSRAFFRALEQSPAGSCFALESMLCQLSFDSQGLIPVITQCAESGEVLMMAWMNAQSLRQTLDTGRMTYWSRSRQQLWAKGETSGHIQQLEEMRIDCDGDALLCRVTQQGPACHTGRRHCFYYSIEHSDSAECPDSTESLKSRVRVTASVPESK